MYLPATTQPRPVWQARHRRYERRWRAKADDPTEACRPLNDDDFTRDLFDLVDGSAHEITEFRAATPHRGQAVLLGHLFPFGAVIELLQRLHHGLVVGIGNITAGVETAPVIANHIIALGNGRGQIGERFRQWFFRHYGQYAHITGLDEAGDLAQVRTHDIDAAAHQLHHRGATAIELYPAGLAYV